MSRWIGREGKGLGLDEVSRSGSRRLDEHSLLLHVCSMISYHGGISDDG